MSDPEIKYAKSDTYVSTINPDSINFSERSDWTCYLFGGSATSSIIWVPTKDEVPCWFWRKMQWLCFGNKWEKNSG